MKVFIGVCNWSLHWDKSAPRSTLLLTSLFILSSHKHPSQPKLSFPQALCLFLISPVRATSLTLFIILITFIEEHKLWSSSVCIFLQTLINYLFLNYFLSVSSSQIPSIDFIPVAFHIYIYKKRTVFISFAVNCFPINFHFIVALL